VDKLTAALDTGSVPSVSGKALRDLRRWPASRRWKRCSTLAGRSRGRRPRACGSPVPDGVLRRLHVD
jgi:hypothetical protein